MPSVSSKVRQPSSSGHLRPIDRRNERDQSAGEHARKASVKENLFSSGVSRDLLTIRETNSQTARNNTDPFKPAWRVVVEESEHQESRNRHGSGDDQEPIVFSRATDHEASEKGTDTD